MSELRRKLRRIRDAAIDELDVELAVVANDLLARSRAVAPELERDLIRSGDVLRVRRGDGVTYVVFYTSPYAVIRHEDRYNLGPISRTKPPTADGPIGRKYLQRPFERNTDRWVKQLAQVTEQAIRRAAR